MPERTPVGAEALGGAGKPALEWQVARERLENPEAQRTNWLATASPDGTPHLTPLIGLWLEGAFYFLTGVSTRKGQNLAVNPRCAVAFGSTTLPSLDVILEGEAHKVTGDATLRRLVDAYGSRLNWPLELREGEIFGPNAPSAGPPPYAFFELVPTTVTGLPGLAGTENGLQDSLTPTRWRF